MKFNPIDALHMFRGSSGHLTDSPENRQLLIDTIRPEHLLGTDQFGSSWYSRLIDAGQLWVLVRGEYIRNGGVNETPRTFNELTGLSAREPKHGRAER